MNTKTTPFGVDKLYEMYVTIGHKAENRKKLICYLDQSKLITTISVLFVPLWSRWVDILTIHYMPFM